MHFHFHAEKYAKPPPFFFFCTCTLSMQGWRTCLLAVLPEPSAPLSPSPCVPRSDMIDPGCNRSGLAYLPSSFHCTNVPLVLACRIFLPRYYICEGKDVSLHAFLPF
uniref:Uncharacterized protein n=1 Tax=Sparus aurata TaxID=8175 RepID=A0A671YHV4_SPAAU